MRAMLMCLALAACAPVSQEVTPRLASYTPEEQKRAAAELRALPPDAILRRFMADYGTLRDQVRSLQP